MPKFNAKTICRIAILAALYVPLAVFASIQIGNVRISFGSLPVVVSALLFGPVESILVAAVGEFFKQLLTYGITATRVLYLIPPALRGAIIGVAVVQLWKRSQRLEDRKVLYYGICICAGLPPPWGTRWSTGWTASSMDTTPSPMCLATLFTAAWWAC